MSAVARDVLAVLLASVWQGACVALAVAAVLAFAGRGLNAATRSIVWQGALLAIVIVPLLTTLPNGMTRASSQGGRAVAASAAAPAGAPKNDTVLVTPRRIDVTLNDRAAFVLTGLWAAGVLVFALRLGAGSLQLARLVRRSTRLAERGGVPLYASPDIGVPLAFGFVAPAVVVPAALAAAAGEQFDCIVLHELAHVRRRDTWANACERVLHVFLYFNPTVWFVLRAIALEREAACDDWAVVESRDLDAYTRSLASFAVWGADARAVTACGATGFGHATLARIRRLDDARRNGGVTLSKYALGGFAIALLFLALSLRSFAPAIAFAPQPPVAPVVVASSGCRSPFRFPRPPRSLKSFDLKVATQTSPAGIVSATVVKSSGDPSYDRAFVAAVENDVPCKKRTAGRGFLEIQTDDLHPRKHWKK